MQETLPPWIAWSVVLIGYLLPLAHVVLSKHGGPWRAPAEGRCPFSPRAGWIVMVLLLGVFGWLLYMRARRRGQPAEPTSS